MHRFIHCPEVSTHSRLKAAGTHKGTQQRVILVSTHSRLKAAGRRQQSEKFVVKGFNTQPPEGGWSGMGQLSSRRCGFNTQPPEGGW